MEDIKIQAESKRRMCFICLTGKSKTDLTATEHPSQAASDEEVVPSEHRASHSAIEDSAEDEDMHHLEIDGKLPKEFLDTWVRTLH